MARKTRKNDDYKVGAGDADVKIAVDVGLGQRGTAKVSLAGRSLATTAAPLSLTIGPRDDVAGKLLTIETVVTDVSTMTNKMSVTVKLSGGPSAKTVTNTGEVSDAGDSIIFQTLVLLRG